jgi:exo-1,4-beta-D-glucosaminidase
MTPLAEVTVDTVSSLARRHRRATGTASMAGPYSWRPPGYWFSGRYGATRGSTAEQGDNEHIPPFASLKKFIPPDKLWPINDTWYFHAGANPKNATLNSIKRAVDRRYGPSDDAEEFTRKAQLAHYESTRAQFEAFAAERVGEPQDDHLLDAEQSLAIVLRQPLRLLPASRRCVLRREERASSRCRWCSTRMPRAITQAHVTLVNQTPDDRSDLRVRVRVYDLQGKMRDDRTTDDLSVASGGSVEALTLPRMARDSSVFFVRCEVVDDDGTVVAENVYWQSQQRDDLGVDERLGVRAEAGELGERRH